MRVFAGQLFCRPDPERDWREAADLAVKQIAGHDRAHPCGRSRQDHVARGEVIYFDRSAMTSGTL